MKISITIWLLFFGICVFQSCSKKEPIVWKDYKIKIVYTNGDIEIESFSLPNDSKIIMDAYTSGPYCLKARSEEHGLYTLQRCEIRTFEVLN